MRYFENIHFHGKFRDYQSRVLDRADQYLSDGKINIVAAPGSGKTVLGLELIRRLDAPCIILSPTTAIREQWGQRFRDLFLDDPNQLEALFSKDLHNVRLINSITYQALYTAIEKVSSADPDDPDCSDIDLFETMRNNGIQTICLDEAHHLKNEWQRALEKFIASLHSTVKIISLTATPPYDSEGTEWNRYLRICGEIDEEIFVPELVGQNALCPHQDYVYFNYPSQYEISSFQNHIHNAVLAIDDLRSLPLFHEIGERLNRQTDYEILFASAKEYIALLVLLDRFGVEIRLKLVSELTTKRKLPPFRIQYAETALQFLLDGDLITDVQKDQIIAILKAHSVYDKRRVTLSLNEKLKRSLITSVGKLESIKQITQSEVASMGENLRMLILTDYIQKENLSKIATAFEFTSVSVVSIFETIRREHPKIQIGVLSGTLIILPQTIDLASIKCKKEPIPGTQYCIIHISGSTHRAVEAVGKLFEEGKLQILIGTKSLLGEGWDSPCINSLILASFVGSFVLSNQMRGRAIRIDKNNPSKSANIWHLVTVEPEYLFADKVTERIQAYLHQDHTKLTSYDFDVLRRRFDSFMGPNYTTGVIESGIERLTAIRPPYSPDGIAQINARMLELSHDRDRLAEQWKSEVSDGKFAVAVETEVPNEGRVPVFTFWNFALNSLIAMMQLAVLYPLWRGIATADLPLTLAGLLTSLGVSILLWNSIKRLVMHCNPARSIKTLGTAVYRALRECELIAPSAKVETIQQKDLWYVSLHLRNASIHDQNIFNAAMTEMLSPIENPRYILIAKTRVGYRYHLSFACPSVIGKKKEYVEVLAEKLKAFTGNFVPIYTHTEGGRNLILKCRKKSYITHNIRSLHKKYKVSHWE